MASMSSQKASSTSFTLPWKYDVFLSFRGEDTRNNFVGHLYKALDHKGIHTFKDDEKLQKGKAISLELLKSIEASRFSVVVLSKNYASSTWCLDELVKIIDCMDMSGQTVLPIFYNVDPSHVRKQTGMFVEVFAKHEEDFKEEIEKVHKWRSALTKLANLSGWDSRLRDESLIIEEMVGEIFKKLICTSSVEAKDLVGMTSCINEMNSLLCIGLDDVRIVGIWGMGGIGKTTIARAVYDRISNQFEGHCFLANVKDDFRKHGPAHLQEKLLFRILSEKNLNVSTLNGGFNVIKERLGCKKVLIVLDDIDKLDQLETLVGKQYWFGPGSRIIITTRDKQLLVTHGVDDIYEAKLLPCDQALQLFMQYAFKQSRPTENFMDLSRHAVNYAQGLPLALKVLGSFLFSRSILEWKDALKKLEKIPDNEIQNVLRMSFDGLDDLQKDIFLDVACFFQGMDKDYVTKLLDSCGLFAGIGIRVLVDKSLITILENKLWMHDLLQEMGWELVRQESIKEPGKRSRLWICEEVDHALMQNTATEAVEGIILDLVNSKEAHLNTRAFARMSRLRLLKIHYRHLSRDFEYHSEKELCPSTSAYERMKAIEHCKVQLCGDFEFLSHELRCLCWHGYPLRSLPSNFHPGNLIELDMRCSHIEQLWNRVKPLEKLEYINLSYSEYLNQTPDFTGLPNLKRLILEGCTKLFDVHPSIGCLNNLIVLSLKDCIELRSLPSSICLKSLKTLIFSGCSHLEKFPEISGNMEHLSELSLDGTAIDELPSSIEHLKGLVLLNLEKCLNLASLPNSICNLKFLENFTLSGCSKLDKLPENIGNLYQLAELKAEGIAINQLPPSIVYLSNLKLLSLRGCKEIPSWTSLFSSLLLPRKVQDSSVLSLPSSTGLFSLTNLDVSDCNLSEIPNGFGCLSSLRILKLSRNIFESLPASIKNLSELQHLYLDYCKRLQIIPELPSSTKFIDAHDCVSLEAVSGKEIDAHVCMSPAIVSRLEGLNEFVNFTNCFKLIQNQCSNIVASAALQIQLMATRSLNCYTKGCFSVPSFSMCFPGSEIPNWFNHQRTGSSITVKLPPHWPNSKSVGFALCTVFSLKDLMSEFFVKCCCCFTTNHGEQRFEWPLYKWKFKDLSGYIGSDHVFLGYAPWYSTEMIKEVEDWPNNCFYVEASFDFYVPRKVKKCGVRLIYAQDEKENNATRFQFSSSYENNGAIYHGFGEPVVEEDTKSKRSRSDYGYDETRASGSGRGSGIGSTVEEEEQPLNKKLKETKYF